jgi:hypothetical protein
LECKCTKRGSNALRITHAYTLARERDSRSSTTRGSDSRLLLRFTRRRGHSGQPAPHLWSPPVGRSASPEHDGPPRHSHGSFDIFSSLTCIQPERPRAARLQPEPSPHPTRPDAPAPLLRLALPVVDRRRRADPKNGPTEGAAEPPPRRRARGRGPPGSRGRGRRGGSAGRAAADDAVEQRAALPARGGLILIAAPCLPLVTCNIVPNKQENLETRRRPHARAHAADNILTSVGHPTNNRSHPTDHPARECAARLADLCKITRRRPLH